MARASKKDEQTWARKLYLFHRECVRRNPQYGREYKRWVESGKPMASLIEGLQGKWKVYEFDPPNPEDISDLDEVLRKGEFPKSVWKILGTPENELMAYGTIKICFKREDFSESQMRNLKGHLFLLYFPEEKEFNWNNTVGVVDMRRPKDEIKTSISEKISSWLTERREAGLKQEKAKERIRLSEAFQYLKAFDLRKKKMTYENISLQLRKGRASSFDAREAKRYCQKGEEFIANPPLLKYSEKDYQEKIQRLLR